MSFYDGDGWGSGPTEDSVGEEDQGYKSNFLMDFIWKSMSKATYEPQQRDYFEELGMNPDKLAEAEKRIKWVLKRPSHTAQDPGQPAYNPVASFSPSKMQINIDPRYTTAALHEFLHGTSAMENRPDGGPGFRDAAKRAAQDPDYKDIWKIIQDELDSPHTSEERNGKGFLADLILGADANDGDAELYAQIGDVLGRQGWFTGEQLQVPPYLMEYYSSLFGPSTPRDPRTASPVPPPTLPQRASGVPKERLIAPMRTPTPSTGDSMQAPLEMDWVEKLLARMPDQFRFPFPH